MCSFGPRVPVEGGGVFLGHSKTYPIVNTIFSRNKALTLAGHGAGIYVKFGTLEATNCTFSANLASASSGLGGGIYIIGAVTNASITNCIFWGNTDSDGGSPDESSQIHDATSAGIDAPTYCDIQGLSGWIGNNNRNDNPQFRDAANDNLRMKFASLLVDVANDTAIPVDDADIDDDGNMTEELPFDLDANTRKVDGIDSGSTVTVDMGAYETCELPELGDTDANGDVDCVDYCYIEDKIGCTVGAGDCTCDVANVDDDGDVDSADLTATGLSGCTPCP